MGRIEGSRVDLLEGDEEEGFSPLLQSPFSFLFCLWITASSLYVGVDQKLVERELTRCSASLPPPPPPPSSFPPLAHPFSMSFPPCFGSQRPGVQVLAAMSEESKEVAITAVESGEGNAGGEAFATPP